MNILKNSYLLPGIAILVLVIQGIISTENLAKSVDIRLWDESMYLGNGINFFSDKPPAYWGPVYSLWYFLLNLFTNDPVNLYYLNYKLMVILLPMVLFGFIYRFTSNVVISFFYSYLLLVSIINLTAWPRVSHFSLILLFISFIIISHVTNNDKKLIVACFTALILTYIRPEFILSFLIFIPVITTWVIKKKMKLIYPIVLASTTIVLLIVLGNPYSSDRSLTAFGQAYEKYVSSDKRIGKNSTSKEWTEILDENFNNPKTLFEVATNNSPEFIKHLWYNIKHIPNVHKNYHELIYPTQFIHIDNPVLPALTLILISLSPFLLLIFSKRKEKSDYSGLLNNLRIIIGLCIIFSLPPLLGMILFFPRLHYIIMLIPLFYSLFVLVFIPLKIKPATEISLFKLCPGSSVG
jgi:hypothetical protein